MSPDQGLVAMFKVGLAKTRQNLLGRLGGILKLEARLDQTFYDELEGLLIQADVGVKVTQKLIEILRERVGIEGNCSLERLKELLKEEIINILGKDRKPLNLEGESPLVILVIGVNGVGKTTTIAKLAYRFKREGKKVLLVAADTFRAAAIEQVEIWGRRIGVETIKHKRGADPAAVVYDAIQSAKAKGIDLLIVDTAGRLHTKFNLMEELKKIKRVVGRELPWAPQEILLVLDANTGQNALSQAKLFNAALGVTGIVLAKLDGSAKGGIIIAIEDELGIPVKVVGVGEGLENLADFSPMEYVEALWG